MTADLPRGPTATELHARTRADLPFSATARYDVTFTDDYGCAAVAASNVELREAEEWVEIVEERLARRALIRTHA